LSAGEGHIVTTCSILGHVSLKDLTAYQASKFGILGYLGSLKLDIKLDARKPKIHFTTVYPGLVRTPMTTKVDMTSRSIYVH
jgi:short-subunit dehydrogenase